MADPSDPKMKFKAAIFDVDDTLLDNRPGGGIGLHERSRVAAAREAGQKWHIEALKKHSYKDAREAFQTAPVHVLESCIWNTLRMAGVVAGDTIDPHNEIFKYMVRRKNELHEAVLRTYGKEVPGATRFVERMAANGLAGHLAIASTAVRRDVLIFLEMTGLSAYFPDNMIVTKEQFTHAKPHPECYDMAFRRLGLPKRDRRRVIAFEDDPRGVMSAKAAGLYVAAITIRHSRESLAALEVAPDLMADSFAEFEQLLELT